MFAVDLNTAIQHLLPHGELARAESKNFHYWLLHAAAWSTRGQRRCWLRTSARGPG
jgi:hypothetical protein